MPESGDAEILTAEAHWIDRYAQNDAVAFERILGDDFLYVSPAGCEVVRRKEYIDNLRDGSTKMTRFAQRDVMVRRCGDVALVTAHADVEENLRGTQWNGAFYMLRAGIIYMVSGWQSRLILRIAPKKCKPTARDAGS